MQEAIIKRWGSWERMKVMLFSHMCGDQFMTGAEKSLLMLVQELSPYLDCVLVVPEKGILSSAAAKLEIKVIEQSYPLLWSLYEPEGTLRQQAVRIGNSEGYGELLELLLLQAPDLVIVNTCVNILPAMAAKKLGIPVAWLITEKINENAWTPLAVEQIDRYSDWIIGISKTVRLPFEHRDIEHKWHLLPPVWREEVYHPETWDDQSQSQRQRLGIGESNPVVGFISASLHKQKGLEHFIKMALEVGKSRPDVRFLIAGGEGDYLDEGMKLIEASGYRDRFLITGFESRLERIYPVIDILVVPSLVDEGFGLTALEGLGFGKTVIAYRSGGLEEILMSTGQGSGLVSKKDLDSLIHHVLERLSDTGASAQLQRQAVMDVYGLRAYRSRLKPLLRQFRSKAGEALENIQSSLEPVPNEGGLYAGVQSPVVFVVENGKKRHIPTPDSFEACGYRWEDVIQVPEAWLLGIPNGTPLSSDAPAARLTHSEEARTDSTPPTPSNIPVPEVTGPTIQQQPVIQAPPRSQSPPSQSKPLLFTHKRAGKKRKRTARGRRLVKRRLSSSRIIRRARKVAPSRRKRKLHFKISHRRKSFMSSKRIRSTRRKTLKKL
ncbi:glycosyltransferase [Paenibacillus radicis (ex Xue et al. 2023)]|uniref:Glycosyltransferase n=1 Tax=Paenibacillus radicis (ex Xue et al. 2023) TaxID=2972489 RepID=A0ABT1YSC7_9BACL|nr:glycosyltransferase [Paenibacillus radicis (ex Xue et al. 2023)]MCR8636081.1 glycosyltransferase [Paenibacillus radicis (ex Xue et al. 2023)]